MKSSSAYGALGLAVWAMTACGPPRFVPTPISAPTPGTASYAPTELVTVNAEIVGVDRTPPETQLSTGVRITVRADDTKTVTIELAPGWWLDEQGIRFSPMERVEVVGARAPAGRADILAWEVHESDRSHRLRDTKGRPLWPSPPGAVR